MSNKLDIKDLQAKTKDELNQELINLRKEQFSLKMSRSTDQDIKVHQFKAVRRNVARVKTALNMI
ncbi:MAG: 50S ribosomal protein L29 [Gammaproteobacteria bacterium]|nr:50S ribosomal protein L29 [Gammaproteobacteria bacterium]